MASQMKALLHKNMMVLKKRPLLAIGFFAVPMFFISFLFVIVAYVEINNVPSCDYETLNLLPSRPEYIVSSLVCSQSTRCANYTQEYKPAKHISRLLTKNSTHRKSRLCPGKTKAETMEQLMRKTMAICAKRGADSTYGSIPDVDLIYRGKLLYFPRDIVGAKIIEIGQQNLDEILELQKGLGFSCFGDMTDDPDIKEFAKGVEEVATGSVGYQPLANRTVAFNNLEEATEHARNMSIATEAVWGIVQLLDTGKHFKYKLITHSGFRQRISSLYLQSLIESAVIQHYTGQKPNIQLEQKLLPKKCHKNPQIYMLANVVIQPLVAFAFAVIVSYCLTNMTQEKEAGLKEFLLIAGVPTWKIKGYWAIFQSVLLALASLLVSVCIKWSSDRLIEHTSFFMIFILMCFYNVAMIAMSFTISSLMSTPQRASSLFIACLLIAYLVLQWGQLVPRVGYTGIKLIAVRLACAFHPVVPASLGMAYILALESMDQGVFFSDLSVSPDPDDGFLGLLECFLWFCFYIPVHLCLSWYFDHVAPSKYGVKYPINFLLSSSYWNSIISKQQNNSEEEDIKPANNTETEHIPSTKQTGIVIKNLMKDYGNQIFGVKNLSVTFYSKEITVLLGHNGAGKSTTMNILTGMISPTGGTATITDKSIHTEMEEIRQTLGFCPQYDIIYPELTVIEHMKFYGDLKNIPQEDIKAFSTHVFTQMKMIDGLNTMAKKLSGGMKRKLSIAIALMGHPTTVILDEPTSAIDPFSRKAIWDLILGYRSASTILISTHYMQEADILADRIAIINKGSLKCFGTPMYLKSRYGSDCKINMAHRKPIVQDELKQQLQTYIPVELFSNTRLTTKYSISLETAHSNELISALEYIEEKGDYYGITSFGISEPTIEEVFFNVVETESKLQKDQNLINVGVQENAFSQISYENLTGIYQVLLQFLGILEKRWILSKRSVVGFLLQILVPLVFTGVLIFMMKRVASSGQSGNDMIMHPWNITGVDIMFYKGTPDTVFIKSLLKNGLGTSCMQKPPFGAPVCSKKAEIQLPSANRNIKVANCDCFTCPADAISPLAPQIQIYSGDKLLYIMGYNTADYLLKSQELGDTFGGIVIENVKLFHMNQTKDLLTKIWNMLILSDNFTDSLPLSSMTTHAASFANWCSALEGRGKTHETQNLSIASPSNNFDAAAKNKCPLPRWVNSNGTSINQTTLQFDKMTPLLNNFVVHGITEVHTLWTGLEVPTTRQPSKHEIQMRHIKASFLNAYFNVLFRSQLPANTNQTEYGITLYTSEQAMDNKISILMAISGILFSYFESLALVMPIFNVMSIIIPENSSGNKQLQVLFGLKKLVYWTSNLLWDMTAYLISLCLMVLLMTIFPEVFDINLTVLFEISILYGLSMTMFAYVLSFALNNSRNATLVILLVAPYFSIAAVVLQLVFYQESWYAGVVMLMDFFPPFFVTDCLLTMELNKLRPKAFQQDLMSWDMLGKRMSISAVFSGCMTAIILLLEPEILSTLFDKLKRVPKNLIHAAYETDPDVLKEQKRVAGGEDSTITLAVEKLVKAYNAKTVAVKGVSFGVSKGECFGLLGINGAGKSTLFKMLTGFHRPTTGDAKINKHSIFWDRSKVSQLLGYCPQENVLFDSMTPLEHLNLYGKIRGIPAKERHELITALIDDLELAPHAKKQSKSLSGGNKRKLNFAISLLDFSDVLFLDEMTTGMDPKARKAGWTCLKKVVSRGCAAVITSHSLEECEALCDNIAIMVNGVFKCIGGVQYLKDKYGNSYALKLRLANGTEPTPIIEKINAPYPTAKVVEEHIGHVEIQIPADSLKLSGLFRVIHILKQEGKIDEFSVSQTTLEHVFVNMAKEQE